jgi:hypothetical protein
LAGEFFLEEIPDQSGYLAHRGQAAKRVQLVL